MDEFTEKERHTIDEIYKREFENLTADEVRLLLRWNANNTLHNAEFEAEQNRRNEYLNEKKKLLNDERKAAIDVLKTKKAIALARLEQVKHGQEKQE